MKYSWKDYKAHVPLWIALVLAYVLAIPTYLLFAYWNNVTFYSGANMYKITWTHFLLPAVGALLYYIFGEWFDEKFGKSADWFFWGAYWSALLVLFIYLLAAGYSWLSIIFIEGILVLLWYFAYANKWRPRCTSDTLCFFVAVLLLYFAGFAVGIWSFGYTFILLGMKTPIGETMLKLFIFLPYWAMLPGLLAGWVARWWEVQTFGAKKTKR
jgi:hypothetical protein